MHAGNCISLIKYPLQVTKSQAKLTEKEAITEALTHECFSRISLNYHLIESYYIDFSLLCMMYVMSASAINEVSLKQAAPY